MSDTPAQCECICGCQVIANRPDTIPYLCSVCTIREMRGYGEFHHLRRRRIREPLQAEQGGNKANFTFEEKP